MDQRARPTDTTDLSSRQWKALNSGMILGASLVLGLVLSLLPTALVDAQARPLGQLPPGAYSMYLAANAALERLLDERVALEVGVQGAVVAERAALDRLTTAEERLSRLLAEWRQQSTLVETIEEQIARKEEFLPSVQSLQQRNERRIEAQDEFLFGTQDSPPLSLRGFYRALDERGYLEHERQEIEASVVWARREQATSVQDLGRINTEFAFFEQQADRYSRDLGATRSRALRATARLITLQGEALSIAEQIQAQFEALRLAGHPVNVALASEGLPPIPEPLRWPAVPPRGYVVPAGAAKSVLRHAEPLRLQGTQLRDVGIEEPNWLAPVRGHLTTPFGDATPYQGAHWAIDIGTKLYEPVLAASDGIVEFVGLAAGENRLASYGLVVVVRHNERVTSLYSHLDDRVNGVQVQVGEAVTKGQILGFVGLTGLSTGPHLHFEVRADNRPIDPLLVIRLN
jgi:murein DD-endopeptidase MepM/ murein hydrolase activator NlpD